MKSVDPRDCLRMRNGFGQRCHAGTGESALCEGEIELWHRLQDLQRRVEVASLPKIDKAGGAMRLG